MLITGILVTRQQYLPFSFLVPSFYMVMEFLEHDLKDLMTAMRDPFLSSEIKCLMLQFLEAMDYLHSNWFLHR